MADTIVDIVTDMLTPQPPPAAWPANVPQSVMAELDALKQQWHAGAFGQCNAVKFHHAVVAALSRKGVPRPSRLEFDLWLGEHC